jgi:hypothetical protein
VAARGETQANVEVSTLVVPAWRLRWRAPELALVLGERALALATTRRDEADRLRAESLVVFAGNRVGRGVKIADRAIDALKAAEAAGEHETAWLLRVELAACARSVGAPLTGFAAVTPVLEAPDVPAELRASALVQASECLVTVGRGDEPTRALAEADQLYVADTTLDENTRLLLRGLIRAVQAAQHRRWGDIAAAIGAAREGLDLLSRFSDPSADSGQGMGRLTLELVLALMDANRLLDASEVGSPMLDRPVRAPSASTTGWMRLALATRVHLPAGRVALAREMLREAAASAERHQLDTLLAESLLALAHVHEVSGELADALTNLRSAHAAERRRARAVYAVRARLAAEFAGVHRQPADLHQQLASLLRPIEGMPFVTDGVLSAALKQQLRQWRPVQVRKGDGLMVKRVRRAAEDMTVEGLSAARQHAADRWRMVQPFGEPDDKTPEPVEPPPATPSSDRTVPASGLIASAGAMVSGRRRAARVAAGEIDDDEPNPATTPSPTTSQPRNPQPFQSQALQASQAQVSDAETTQVHMSPVQQPQPALSPEQERKRKVEQQLMELQREARRQIEAERQARHEQRAQAQREAEAAEEAARQEAARQEAARQEAARQEEARRDAARQEMARQEAARQETARQEAARQEAVRQEEARREAARLEAVRRDVARQEAAHQEVARLAAEREEAARAEAAAREEASGSQQESVLDMLKAQGLRAGGRRRARDSGTAPETPSWRVEPPSRPREDDAKSPDSAASPDFFASAPTASAGSNHERPDSGGSNHASAGPSYASADSSGPSHASADSSYASVDSAGSDYGTSDSAASSSSSAGSSYASADSAGPDYGTPGSAGSSNSSAASAGPSHASADSTGLDYSSPGPAGSSYSPTDSAGSDYRPADPVGPNYFSDPDMTDRTARSGLAAAFGRPPAAPDFGPHLDDSSYPLHTPASGFPTTPVDPDDERRLPDLDFSSLDFGTPKSSQRSSASTPFASVPPVPSPDPAERPDQEPEPGPKPLPAVPDPIPAVPTPDEIPQAPEPDLLSSTFLSSADVEDDSSDVPTVPVHLPRASDQTAPDPSTQPGFGGQAGFGAQSFGTRSFGTRPTFGTQSFGTQPGFAGQSGFGGFGTQPGFGEQADQAAPVTQPDQVEPASSDPAGSDPAMEYDFFAADPESTPSDPVAQPSPVEAVETDPATPIEGGQPETSGTGTSRTEVGGESGARDGRPSSRRKPSDLSLADLLAEALVAYETGRRSDEEQFEATDLGVPEWSATEPDTTADTVPAPERPSGSDLLFSPAETTSGESQPGESRSSSESYFLPEPVRPAPETEQEKTGPIVPVGAVSDSETTGPIRPVGLDGPAGWTLPGT